MPVKRFLSADARPYFAAHELNDFDALWSLSLTPVDAPNLERGGHSEVCRMTLEAPGLPPRDFFLKRQTNHLGRSLSRPWGEPTFAREARNIAAFQRLGIPALESAYFEERRRDGRWQAILVTPALSGYTDMIEHHAHWETLEPATRDAIVDTCADLLGTLHRRRWRHGSLYAKHVFLRPAADAPTGFEARFIDLEKSRPLLNAGREKRRDLEVFARRLPQWRSATWRRFLGRYLQRPAESAEVERWLGALTLPNR